MSDYGLWSVVPPLVAIALALATRQVFVSLGLGIWIGYIIITGGNPLDGLWQTLHAIVAVFAGAGNTRVIIFTLLVGALIALAQRSGGVEAFTRSVVNWLQRKQQVSQHRGHRKRVELLAALTGVVLFIESNISILTVGTLYRPITDQLKVPREKLAYIADSSSAPACALIPVNAWGAYLIGLLAAQQIEAPLKVLAGAVVFNFYPLLALVLLFAIILSGRDFGPMRKAEQRARDTGELLALDAVPMISDEVLTIEPKAGVHGSTSNLIVPLAAMVLLMPVFLVMTGWAAAGEQSGSGRLVRAMSAGSGSTAVLFSVTCAVLLAGVMYRLRGILSSREITDTALTGMGGMVPLAVLMVFAFAIGDLCRELGTGQYVAQATSGLLVPAMIPAVVFVVSCFIAFATGTSWGTFAIMIAIAVPVASLNEVNLSLVVAAAIGGGVFGDHCSPISDTTVISSMASASDHIDHVKTQIPYAATAGGVALILYLLAGVLAV